MTEFAHHDRFSGLARLYGQAAYARLRHAHACVIGLGGVGSWTVEALARSGLRALTLIDLDDICVTNTNRQLHALDGNFGQPKAAALAARIRLIHPDCEITTHCEFLTAATAERLLAPAYDVVIDAIDRVSAKATLIAECQKRARPLVTVGGAGGKRDATRIRSGDLGESHGDDLLRLVRKKLRRDHGFATGEHNLYGIRSVYSAEKPVFPWADGTCSTDPEPGTNLRLDCASGFGTATHVTAAFGLAAAGEALALITT